MTRDEYNILFHKVGLNRVAFKTVNECDEEILALVNEAIAAEREACAKVCEDLPADELITRTEATVWDMATLDCAAAIRERGAP